MVADRHHDQQQLRMQPVVARAAQQIGTDPEQQQPQANGADHQEAGEPVQLARHQQQALALGVAVAGHLRQVDEDPRQVEQPREPAGHEDDVQGLDPEISAHRTIMCGSLAGSGRRISAALRRARQRCQAACRQCAAKKKEPRTPRSGDRGCKALTLSSRKAPAQGGKAGDNILTDIVRNGM